MTQNIFAKNFYGNAVAGDNNVVGDNSSVGQTTVESGSNVGNLSSGAGNSSTFNNTQFTLNYNQAEVLEKILEIREGLNNAKTWSDEEKEFLKNQLNELEKQIKKPNPSAKIIDGVIKGISFLKDYAELGVAIAALIQLFT